MTMLLFIQNRLKSKPLVVMTRVFLGFVFFGGGMSKMIDGFPGLMGPVWLEAALEKYDLGMYARFIAYSQAVTGLLLITGRYAMLGAVMLFPMLLNILMITISMNWRGTPYVVAVFLMMNIFLLLADYHALKVLVNSADNIRFFIPAKIYDLFWEVTWWLLFAVTILSTLLKPLSNTFALIVALAGILGVFAVQMLMKWKTKKQAAI